MKNEAMNTVEYYDGAEPDRLIGAVYIPERVAIGGSQLIGRAILKVLCLGSLRAVLLDAEGNQKDEGTVFPRV